jgi:hypothetical protein
MTVFSPAWFDRHQRSLRLALNTPGLGRELRAALGVQDHGRLARLLPHASIVRHGAIHVADFRTHAKHAKRLRAEFLPLWSLFHWFDSRIANPLIPAFNLGFDTLTAYPDPNPETVTVDGWVAIAAASSAWATLIAAAGNDANDSEADSQFMRIDATGTLNLWAGLRRSIFLFDTSALGAAAVITAGVFSLFGSDKADTAGITPDADVYTSTPASNTALAASDFGNLGTTSQTGAPITYASYSATAYNDWTLNATGRGNISQTGVSKFGIRNANYDVAAVSPTWSASLQAYMAAKMADNIGTTNDPKLVVTYTPAGFGQSRAGGTGVSAAVAIAGGVV